MCGAAGGGGGDSGKERARRVGARPSRDKTGRRKKQSGAVISVGYREEQQSNERLQFKRGVSLFDFAGIEATRLKGACTLW
eukprot:5857905-Pleurochrysis_carterae.AAC.1